jgi:hypothetical protein
MGDRHNIEVALVDKELMHIVLGFLRFADLASVSAVCRFTPPPKPIEQYENQKERNEISFVSLTCRVCLLVNWRARRWRVLARASEVMSVLIRGRVLSIGIISHTGLGYCLLDPGPRYLLPYNIPSLGKQCVWSA